MHGLIQEHMVAHKAGHFVETVENKQGYKIACLEEIALNNKWINSNQISNAIDRLIHTSYGDYLKNLIEGMKFLSGTI